MLYRFWNSDINYHRRINQQNQDSLKNVIDRGIQLMGNSALNDNMFLTWQKYSIDILSLIAKDNPILLSNYYSFMLTLSVPTTTYDKLRKSVKYLIELMKVL